MKEVKIFLLDLNPSSGLGSTLGEILESFPNLGVQLKHEFPRESKSPLRDGELCRVISSSNSDLIFMVLSPSHLEQGRALFQSISRERMGLPIIAVPEACKPDDMLSLQNMALQTSSPRHSKRSTFSLVYGVCWNKNKRHGH